MPIVELKVGIGKSDRTQPLLDRAIETPGIDLQFDLAPSDVIFWKALHSDAFDVTEMSFAAYCILASRNEQPFVGVPVFTSRMFRHSSVYIRPDAGIFRPSDLAGKRIGIPEYQMTAVVWMRGILASEYGVDPRQVKWFKGGVSTPGRKERIPLRLPTEYSVTEIAAEDTLDQYLLSGKIDALISAKIPPSFLRGDLRVKRLFPDYRTVEADFYLATKVFPIMHVLVMRRRLYDQNPAVATAIYRAFDAARALAAERLYDTDTLPYMVPWLVSEMERTFSILGRNYWPYGVRDNRHCIETFLEHLKRQDLLARSIGVEELFASELLFT